MRASDWHRVRIAMVAITTTALVALGAASPAYADEVVIENPLPSWRQEGCNSADRPLGQTFTATVTGELTEVGYWTSTVGYDYTTELRIRTGGPSGAILASQNVTFHATDMFEVTLQSFTLATPVPVVDGQVYAFEIADGSCETGVGLVLTPNDYPGGARYDQEGLGFGDRTFRLVITTTPPDSDADGVADSADRCAGTTFTARPAKLKKNQYWSPSAAGFVDGTGRLAYTLADTGGCSAEQIIAAAGLGMGHLKTGLSIGELRNWVGSVG